MVRPCDSSIAARRSHRRRVVWLVLLTCVVNAGLARAQCSVVLSDVTVPPSAYRDAPLALYAAARLEGCNFSGPIRYHWEFGDGATADTANAIHAYGAGNTYPWSVTASIDGDSDTVTGSIQVDPNCICILPCDVFGPFPGDVGDPVAFQIVPPAACCAVAFSYKWQFGDGSAAVFDQATTHEYAEPGFKRWNLEVFSGSNSCLVHNDLAIGPDLSAERLEIVQTVQDLDNSVRLVANKPTFVRFHVRSARDEYPVSAKLVVRTPIHGTTLYPINPGGLVRVGPDPLRDALNDSFLFEVPSDYTDAGMVTFDAEVNPPTGGPITSDLLLFERDAQLPDTRLSNDHISTTVTFETVPNVRLVLYAVDYESFGRHYTPSEFHQRMLTSWLRRAYPIDDLGVLRRTYDHGNGVPTCGQVNSYLAAKRNLDIAHRWFAVNGIPLTTRYYGMVADGGGFMRGCAESIPGHVASGPTGNTITRERWDSDGSYGDWYGGHELAHTWDRRHAPFCGAADAMAPAYPYPNGNISGVNVGNLAFFGFDTLSRRLYGPDWFDLMTYCDYEWPSDFTYEGLMDRLQSEGGSTLVTAYPRAATDRLLVVGALDPGTGELHLEPLVVIANAVETKERIPGPYAIVLRDAGGSELARYPFTPSESHVDAFADDGSTAPAPSLLFIDELVAYVAGTTRVDIDGPGGTLTTIRAGIHPPTVQLLGPNGGESLAGAKIPVAWSASDVDGDPLTFLIQYSRDNGSSWEVVAQNLTGSSVDIEAVNLPAGSSALVRVTANDGIHSASDQSDASFTIPNHAPTAEIVEPPADATIAIGQTIRLTAEAYDIESGSMTADQLDWYSDRDGYLGAGSDIATTLSEGAHEVRFRADDDRGGLTTDTVRVTVAGSLSQLPPVADAIEVAPSAVQLDLASGQTSRALKLTNHNPDRSVEWSAAVDVDWLELSERNGTTPGATVVAFTGAPLGPGRHFANLTFSTPAAPEADTVVTVQLQIPGEIEPCRGDCDGNSAVTVDELIQGVNIALGVLAIDVCLAMDGDGDRQVTVDEVLTAVQRALLGCGSPPATISPGMTLTPTATRTVSATTTLAPTHTPTATPLVTITVRPSTTPTRTSAITTSTPTATASSHRYCASLSAPLAIPDNDEEGVLDQILVPAEDDVPVRKLRVEVAIDHTWVGDLSVFLFHGESLTVTTLLFRPGVRGEDELGCSGDDIRCIFEDDSLVSADEACSEIPPAIAGTLYPLDSLAAFLGEDRAGTWDLAIVDNAVGDTGSLLHWCLELD